MKDKRQRMALAWPFGIADPAIFSYLANAAAATAPFSPYPYAALPSAMGPINHYASLGLHRAAAAYHPYGGHGMRHGGAELLSHAMPLARPQLPGEHIANIVTGQLPIGSAMPTCNVTPRDHHPLMSHHHPAARGLHTSSGASPRLSVTEPINCHAEKSHSLMDRRSSPPCIETKPIVIKPKANRSPISTDSSKPSKPAIFRPFGTDE